tara:strand:+ start:233 stop:688 length:456 start_codon:yes stop_codon:yes gene_type:complete
MNHCSIQAIVKTGPQMRYTKENQTPIAEMMVGFKGLRNDAPSSELKVLGWGAIAQEMVDNLKEGQGIVIEGRLRMNNLTRKDGTKEKQAELTASRVHLITLTENNSTPQEDVSINNDSKESINPSNDVKNELQDESWNSSPLVPEVDEIPF